MWAARVEPPLEAPQVLGGPVEHRMVRAVMRAEVPETLDLPPAAVGVGRLTSVRGRPSLPLGPVVAAVAAARHPVVLARAAGAASEVD
jgi:hypothetical protein